MFGPDSQGSDGESAAPEQTSRGSGKTGTTETRESRHTGPRQFDAYGSSDNAPKEEERRRLGCRENRQFGDTETISGQICAGQGPHGQRVSPACLSGPFRASRRGVDYQMVLGRQIVFFSLFFAIFRLFGHILNHHGIFD